MLLLADHDAADIHQLVARIVAQGHPVLPCKDGFLLLPNASSSDEDENDGCWGSGWTHKALCRPLVFCHLQLAHSLPHSVYLRARLLPTPYLPLDPATDARAPILLLPHATPAYFLSHYAGPSSALVRQFADAFPGIRIRPSFVIGWISVENRRGEDKGITFVYPAQLCVAFAPALDRPRLEHTPLLPAPLQPSPRLLPPAPHRPSLLGSPSTELRAFRALTLSKPKNIRSLAAQVSRYVDHVARDRDRERERLKRERTLPQTPAAPPYPSPPQAESTTSASIPGNTSPVLPPPQLPQSLPLQPTTPTPPPQPLPSLPQQQQPPPPPPPLATIHNPLPPPQPPPPPSSYDPFGYLSDMDFGMDFGMSMSINQSANSNPNPSRTGDRSAFGIDFDEVTDDDFNFFDQPSTLTSPPLLDDVHTGPPLLTPHSQQHQIATPVFTPDSVVPRCPSPEIKSPDPVSLNVLLDVFSAPTDRFDPIPFANYHRIADGKYGPTGKFGLPSPPPEDLSWRNRYDAATDPRVGVVRKLKRKHTTQGGRDVSKQNPWVTEHEEWASHEPGMDASDDEASQSDEELEEEEDTPATSRPCTPPPSYLPLGPTLLQTHFHHTHLLPLSKPLRPPGSSISGSGNQAAATPAPIASVPTPVSPAAGLGLTAEKWRTLEVVVNLLAKEAIENAVWRDAWSASNAFAKGMQGKKLTEIWVSDVKMVEKIFRNLDHVRGCLSMSDLFGSTAQIMNTPKISLGKGDAIINILPPALRFWGKLGLGPKNGEKNATVYVLFADDGEPYRQHEVASWLDGVRTAYEIKHLGMLEPGTYVKDGLFQLKFDLSFRKHFDSFITNLSGSSAPTVLFLVVPITLMTLSSTLFRRILSSVQKSLRTHSSSQIIVQLVPEHVINYMEHDPASTHQLESFCMNLYNRILVPIDQPLARRFTPDNTPISIKALLQKPIFTLAGPMYNTVTYTRTAFSSLDVLDRYRLLHVGYRISTCGKWVMAACVDQRGEVWEQAVWLVNQDGEGEGNGGGGGGGGGATAPLGGSEEMFVVKRVWNFVAGFAVRADVEWRIVISKLGIMEEAEFAAWTILLPTALAMDYPRSVHVSLLCVDPDSPWLFTKFDMSLFGGSQSLNHNHSNNNNNNNNAVFSDTSSTTYAASLNIILPLATPPSQLDIGISLPYVADPSSTNNDGDAEMTAQSPSASTVAHPNTPPTDVTSTTVPTKAGLVPKLTSCLIRVPRSAPLTSISMLHIHLLSTYSSSSFLPREEDDSTNTHPNNNANNSNNCNSNNENNNNGNDKSTTTSSAAAAAKNMLDSRMILADVTRNFYELSVLAQVQWKLSGSDDDGGGGGGVATHAHGGGGGGSSSSFRSGGSGGGGDTRFKTGANPILPVHLAMVDVMGQVTDGVDCTELDS